MERFHVQSMTRLITQPVGTFQGEYFASYLRGLTTETFTFPVANNLPDSDCHLAYSKSAGTEAETEKTRKLKINAQMRKMTCGKDI